jgi:hypothetical protein
MEDPYIESTNDFMLPNQSDSQQYFMDSSQNEILGDRNIRVSVDDSGLDYHYQSHRGGAGAGDGHSEHSYPTLRRVSSQNGLSYSPTATGRQSLDDSSYLLYGGTGGGDMRMQKIAAAESAIRKEMFKECTFKPKIKSLPTQYGPLKEYGTPFVTRVMKWKKEKEVDLQNKMQVSVKSQEESCSFQPKINKNSVIAMKEIRGSDSSSPSHETANDRLFKSYLTIADQRQKLVEDVMYREEKRVQQECTFHPQIITKGKSPYEHVQAKFNRANDPNVNTGMWAKHNNYMREENRSVTPKECTFTPKVRIHSFSYH